MGSPCLEYGGVLLVGCSKKQQAQLDKVQRRALRIISRGEAVQPQNMHPLDHPLMFMLPPKRDNCTSRLLRNSDELSCKTARTNHLRNGPLPTAVRLYKKSSS
jgi:hypothetical protein